MPHKLNNKGFAAVETLLIVVIVALLAGVGYYVWHTNQQTKATLDAANKVAQSSPAKVTKKSTTTSTQQFVTIKEWGVRAPYSGSLHLQYTLKGSSAIFTSTEVAAYGDGCAEEGGGWITRYAPGDDSTEAGDGSGPTVAVAAAQTPDQYNHIGNYYYHFAHSQSACTDPSNATAAALQSETNDAVKALVPKLAAIPAE